MKRSPVFDSDDIRHCEEGALPNEAIPATGWRLLRHKERGSQ